ncbi:5'-methylthioadenosine/adenosylhomocysteine nucleosidase [Falsibacillus pallidus]|uniref:5'-methylthioadenosine/adenosylhomocysteine nucleosidase n=1 Tax=Falsibacillus pallidus TaxID=493781 RepID=UPI003D978E5A
MKKIGIIGAMQIEIDLLLDKMEVVDELMYAGFPFYVGTLYGKEIVLTRCGVGKVNSASCTQILIDKFNVEYIINTGIAGSLKDNIGICDVVLSSDVTHHDVRKDQMRNLFPFQETFIASEELIKLAVKACASKDINCHIGRIISGECFVENHELRSSLIKNYSPACVEMESSSIGHVAFINNIPFLIIRSISDNADEEAINTYSNFEKIAGEQSASIVSEIVRSI